jgi:hypothetical protein
VEMPDSLRGFMKGKKETVVMKSGSEHLADFLTCRYSSV